MSNYDESYMGKIRKLIGKQTFIVTAARGILRDPEGRIPFGAIHLEHIRVENHLKESLLDDP